MALAQVHFSLTHPFATLHDSAWLASLRQRLARTGAWVLRECEQAGQRRANAHLQLLARRYDYSSPELARDLRKACRP